MNTRAVDGNERQVAANTVGLIRNAYLDDDYRIALRDQFCRQLFVHLPELLKADRLADIVAAARAVARHGRRRDFVMPEYETPRKLIPTGGRKIAEHSPLLHDLYFNTELRQLVACLVGQAIFDCQHPDEHIVLNHLAEQGDTHGWHLDDPTWALVLVLESPDARDGGVVEIIRPDSRLAAFTAEATRDIVERAEALGLIIGLDLRPGDAYLLRADRCLHRVSPIALPSARRTALNLAFESSANPDHAHYLQTTTLMYGGDGA